MPAVSALLLSAFLLASTVTGFAAEYAPLFLSANQLSIATGKPSLVMMSSASTHIPVRTLSVSIALTWTVLPSASVARNSTSVTVVPGLVGRVAGTVTTEAPSSRFIDAMNWFQASMPASPDVAPVTG